MIDGEPYTSRGVSTVRDEPWETCHRETVRRLWFSPLAVPARIQRKLPIHPLEMSQKVRGLLYRDHPKHRRPSSVPHRPDYASQQ